jgi:molybdate transport system substrate-binding protein
MTDRRTLLGLPLAAVLPALPPRRAAAQAPATVAAAANVKPAIEELAAQFERAGGGPLRLVFGSSGNFVAQILQGAPFHLFVSADEETVFRVAAAGRTLGGAADRELRGLGAALRDGRVQKLAIANPEHAPYGQRAREALQHAGLWDLARPRLVIGENVSQAVQFALSGSAQGGLVAHSLTLVPAVAAAGTAAVVPAAFHAPLTQRLALIQGAPAAARAFHDFLLAPSAQAVWQRHGYTPPGG